MRLHLRFGIDGREARNDLRLTVGTGLARIPAIASADLLLCAAMPAGSSPLAWLHGYLAELEYPRPTRHASSSVERSIAAVSLR